MYKRQQYIQFSKNNYRSKRTYLLTPKSFNNSNVLYNLIQVITQLLGQMDVNSDRVSEFNAQQGNYIEDMKKVLDEFRIDNFNVA